MRNMKKIAGVLLGVGGGFAILTIWSENPLVAAFLVLVTLSSVIEMFKPRKLQIYDYVAALIILVALVYALMSWLGIIRSYI